MLFYCNSGCYFYDSEELKMKENTNALSKKKIKIPVQHFSTEIIAIFSFLQVFEYDAVINDVVDIHYPVHEMVCNSKIRYNSDILLVF